MDKKPLKARPFTPYEKAAFKDIVRKYKNVVENKKSDGASLRDKEKTWTRIAEEYNSLKDITQSRDVSQLRKLWTNMKHAQRTALTKEKQCRMATGGGPAEPTPEVDPNIAEIAPHLMVTAPTLFTSNMSDTEFEERSDDILKRGADVPTGQVKSIDSGFGKYSISFEAPEVIIETPSSAFSPSNVESKPIVVAGCSKFSVTPQRREKVENKDISASKRRKLPTKYDDEESSLKLQRLQALMQQEKELANLKLNHEKEIHEFKKAIYTEQLSEATAKAELAALLLGEEKQKYF